MQPGADPSEYIDDLRNTISVQRKESPSIKCKIGEEDMDNEQIIDNVDAVVTRVTGLLPQSEHNIKDVIIKLTMGQPVEVQ
jgi:large subunit ribosomal protein L1